MSPPDEPLQSLPARVTSQELEVAARLGSGNRSLGVRRALQIAQQHQLTGSPRVAGALKASQLIEELALIVRQLEEASAADVVGSPSGGAWLPNPSASLILQVREATGAHVVATPRGVMVFGIGTSGADAALALDMDEAQLGLTDLGGAGDLNVSLDLPGLAAVVDLLGEAHRQAREAIAAGKGASAARAVCPGLQLEIHPVAASGNAAIHLAGQTLEVRPLVFLQLLAEAASLLAREVARSVADRQHLESLVSTQPVPAVAWERSHGDH